MCIFWSRYIIFLRVFITIILSTTRYTHSLHIFATFIQHSLLAALFSYKFYVHLNSFHVHILKSLHATSFSYKFFISITLSTTRYTYSLHLLSTQDSLHYFFTSCMFFHLNMFWCAYSEVATRYIIFVQVFYHYNFKHYSLHLLATVIQHSRLATLYFHKLYVLHLNMFWCTYSEVATHYIIFPQIVCHFNFKHYLLHLFATLALYIFWSRYTLHFSHTGLLSL